MEQKTKDKTYFENQQNSLKVAEDIKPNYKSLNSISPNVSLQNQFVQNYINRFDELQRPPDEEETKRVKNFDVKEILLQAEKELNSVEHYASQLVNASLE